MSKKKIGIGIGIFIVAFIVIGAIGAFQTSIQKADPVKIQAPQPQPEQVRPAPEPQQPIAPKPQEVTPVCKGKARCFTGEVKKIVDGDTLDIGDFRIRLTLVNTPERGEPGWSEATKFTAAFCPVGSQALVDEDDKQIEGSYGRMIGLVYCNGKILNSELLTNNLAKILTEFCKKSEFAAEIWAKGHGC